VRALKLTEYTIYRRGLNRFTRERGTMVSKPETVTFCSNAPAGPTQNLLETMETIREAGARFQSLSEPWANTTSHAGKLIMTVFAGIAEFERDLIRERTSAGREAARRRGIHFGRPRKLNPEQTKLACRLIDEGQSVKQIADTFNVHTATIYRLSATAA